MKAIVKATGDIIEISEDCSYLYAEHYDKSYNLNQLEFLDVKEKSFPQDNPDYWTRLEHQYAGMAMQGILANIDLMMSLANKKTADYPAKNTVAEFAKDCAHALVEKLKEKEERKRFGI